MYIKQIELQNFQTIKEFSGNFDGNIYLVTGENELGKSTLLKAIVALLTGNRDEVLRNGEEKGFAKMIVGDDGNEYEVKLSMTKNNPRGTITITSKATGLRSDRITALQEIFGYQDFDANEFVSWSETAEGRRKQVQVVRSLLPEQAQREIDSLDADVLRTKEERKDDNAQVKTYSAILSKAEKELNPGDLETYSAPIDMQDLLEHQREAAALVEKAKSVKEKLQMRENVIAGIDARKQEADARLKDHIESDKLSREQAKIKMEREIAEIKEKYAALIEGLDRSLTAAKEQHDKEISAIEYDLQDAITRKENCQKWLSDYEKNKPEDISKQIADVQAHNDKYRKVRDYMDAKQNLDDAEKKVADHEEKLRELADKREAIINAAKLPIPGLNFTEDGLELDGIPFVAGKVSDSQIMEVAAKLIIAKNPTVKVFRIARGESLGKKKLEALVKFAKEQGYQGFIEQVVREQNELRVEQYTEK